MHTQNAIIVKYSAGRYSGRHVRVISVKLMELRCCPKQIGYPSMRFLNTVSSSCHSNHQTF